MEARLVNNYFDPRWGYLIPYEVLGVSPKSSLEEVIRGYRKKAMRLHPDKCKDRDSTEEFKILSVIYSYVLEGKYQETTAPHDRSRSSSPESPRFRRTPSPPPKPPSPKFKTRQTDKCKFRCQVCGRFFHTSPPCLNHQQTCNNTKSSRKGAAKSRKQQ